MEVSLEKIKEITRGAVNVFREGDGVRFLRFTPEQLEFYKRRNLSLYDKANSTAGIKMVFKTDSKALSIKFKVARGSSRKYFSLDVFSDGVEIGSVDSFSCGKEYEICSNDFGSQEFGKEFELGDGIKTVSIYFPWSVNVLLTSFCVDDTALLQGVKCKKKLIAFGDSITQGYDNSKPSNRYMSLLCDRLDAEEYSKAIGAEVFCSELAGLKDNFSPDYVTVAYGTNDWSKTTFEVFKASCRGFFENLKFSYPDAKIFAITPIWRKEYNSPSARWEFEKAGEFIEATAKELGGITVIPGFDFVPKDEKYFADLVLHPNDEGNRYYFEALYSEIIKYI